MANGNRLCEHKFHYSPTDAPPDATFAFDVERGKGIDNGRDGLTERSVLGTYCNANAESEAFDVFVEPHYLS